MIRVAFWVTVIAMVVGVGLVLIPTLAMILGHVTPSICGSHCLPPGVTENPAITKIGW